tara:strand:+ start:14 stop:1300 length:1287 start_codon:yes stop_codon:yes gene_type:complete
MSTILVNNVKSYTGSTVTISGSNIAVQGNTTLGDSVGVDTITVNGHITASGNISASGTVFASKFESAGPSGEVITFNDNLDITGNITASNDLSLNSDSSVFNMGAGNDFTITHDGTTGAVISATPITINSVGELTLSASSDLNISASNGTASLSAKHVDIDVTSEIDFTVGGFVDFNIQGNLLVDASGISLDSDGVAANFTVASDGAGEDLTISLTGATDSSVVISSTGTGADAINIDTTAGSIDIDSADNITVNAADDIAIQTTTADGELILSSSHTAGRAIHINATANAGSIVDIDAGILDIDVTGDATITAANIFAKHITLNQDITAAAPTDAAFYILNGKRGEIRSQLQTACAADTGFTIELRNTSIAANSLIVANVIGGEGAIRTGSVLTANTIGASSASFNFFNTGVAIVDNAIFTASFAVL